VWPIIARQTSSGILRPTNVSQDVRQARHVASSPARRSAGTVASLFLPAFLRTTSQATPSRSLPVRTTKAELETSRRLRARRARPPPPRLAVGRKSGRPNLPSGFGRPCAKSGSSAVIRRPHARRRPPHPHIARIRALRSTFGPSRTGVAGATAIAGQTTCAKCLSVEGGRKRVRAASTCRSPLRGWPCT